MSRRMIAAIAGGGLVVVLAVGVLLLLGSGGRGGGQAPAASPVAATSSSTASPSGASQQAHQVASALSRLVSDPQSLVAGGAAAQLGSRARQAVPAGSKVTVNEASWAPDGAGGGVITLTLTAPGQAARTYVAVMVAEAGGWKVLETVPLEAAPAATGTTVTGTTP